MKRHNGKINDSKIRSSVNNQVLVDDSTISDGTDLSSTDRMIPEISKTSQLREERERQEGKAHSVRTAFASQSSHCCSV